MAGRLIIGGALLGAAAIAVPTAAGLATKRASTTVAFNTAGSVTATCKQGTKAVSGGFLDEAFEPGPGSRLYAYRSRKVGSDAWSTSGFNYGGGDATLTTYAYCAKGKGVKTRSASIELPDGDATGTAVATCKQGERAVSGGFEDPEFDTGFPITGSRVLVHTSRKLGKRKWEVTGFNNGTLPGHLTAYVYCGKGKRVKTRSDSVELDVGETGPPAVAACKRRDKALSGGFDTELDAAGEVTYVLPYGSRKVGNRKWEVAGYSDGVTSGSVTAYVYCRKR